MEKFVHKLKKTNNYSYSLIIPKEVIDKYGWQDGQKISVRDKGRGVVEIRDWRNR